MKTPWEYAATGNEHSHQVALFMWANMAAQFGLAVANNPHCYTEGKHFIDRAYNACGSDPLPQLKWLFAINNAVGRNSKAHGARNAAEGVKPGVPDICLPVPTGAYENGIIVPDLHGLYIELKRPVANLKRKGVIADKQSNWIAYLMQAGYQAEVCYGWEAARDAILKYLGLANHDESSK